MRRGAWTGEANDAVVRMLLLEARGGGGMAVSRIEEGMRKRATLWCVRLAVGAPS